MKRHLTRFTFRLKIAGLCMACIISSSALGQHQFGVAVNSGFSLIKGVSMSSNLIKYENKPRISFSSGFFYNYYINKNIFFGLGAEFMFLSGKIREEYHTVSIHYPSQINYIDRKYDYKRRLNYFGVPVSFGYVLKKFSIEAAIQPCVVISNTVEYSGSTVYSGGQNNTESHSGKVNLDKTIDLGGFINLKYKLSSMFSAKITYFVNTNKIDSRNYGKKKERINYLSIGLQFNFIKSKEKE